jgi:6-pyruvoyltetrahydropterin/6-carboxytetrahydropterin synthase
MEKFPLEQTDANKVLRIGRFESTKTYNHSVGLSCCFRQWRAESHCRFLHGYALKVHFTFEASTLDARNWVVDFGSLKSLRGWLESTFDHTTLVASDDPMIDKFYQMQRDGLILMRIVPACGCEAMAYMIYQYTESWISDNGYNGVLLRKVTVAEHEGNSASYFVQDPYPEYAQTRQTQQTQQT